MRSILEDARACHWHVRAGCALTAVLTVGLLPPLERGAAAAPALPDARAYELVSPPAKRLGEVVRVLRAANDGEAVAFQVSSGPDGVNGVHVTSYTVARRHSSGWERTSADVAGLPFPRSSGPSGVLPVDFSTDLSSLLEVSTAPLADGDFGLGDDLYSINVGADAAQWLSAPTGMPMDTYATASYGQSSADFSRTYFSMLNGKRLPDAPDSALYEWRAGNLRIASILPDGTPSLGRLAADAGARTGMGSDGGSMAVPHRGTHAVSDDGSSVYWTTLTGGPLYLSRDGQPAVAVSASRQTGHEGEAGNAFFVGATPDGTTAYLVSTWQLTDQATTTAELYRYDADSGNLTLITSNAAGNSGGQVVDAMLSEDGERLYFTAQGALTPGAEAGATNAYVLRNGNIHLIGALDGPGRVARLSRGAGQYALIETRSNLAGTDTHGHAVIYEYDDATGHIVCVSCPEDGGLVASDAYLGEVAQTVPLANSPIGEQRQRNVTDDGRVFFMTAQGLSTVDVNDAIDVYEYDHGRISLLTSGRSDYGSFLADNSDDGQDVFILTRSPLVGDDTDDLYDVYDVRIGGGFATPDVGPVTSCVDDDCQGPRENAKSLPSAASALGTANGNVSPARTPPARSVRLLRISPSQVRQLKKTGTIIVPVRVTGGGVVQVTARLAGVGNTSHSTRVVRQASPVTAHIRLRLSVSLRRQLERRSRSALVLAARIPGARASTRTITLNMSTALR